MLTPSRWSQIWAFNLVITLSWGIRSISFFTFSYTWNAYIMKNRNLAECPETRLHAACTLCVGIYMCVCTWVCGWVCCKYLYNIITRRFWFILTNIFKKRLRLLMCLILFLSHAMCSTFTFNWNACTVLWYNLLTFNYFNLLILSVLKLGLALTVRLLLLIRHLHYNQSFLYFFKSAICVCVFLWCVILYIYLKSLYYIGILYF